MSSCIAERLESRRLLSGNVTASVVDGSLLIWGDNVANDIVVDAMGLAAGQVRIASGENVTSINGQAAPVVLEGLTGNAFIGMRQGPDRLVLRDVNLPGNLEIQTGLGIDNVSFLAVEVQGNAQIRTGIKADALNIDDSTMRGETLINMRWGADSVRIEQSGDMDGPRSLFYGATQIMMSRGIDDVRLGLDDNAGNLAVFYGEAAFDGGVDYDELRAGNGNWFDFDPVITNFEYNELAVSEVPV